MVQAKRSCGRYILFSMQSWFSIALLIALPMSIFPNLSSFNRDLQLRSSIDRAQSLTPYHPVVNQRSIDFQEGSLNVDPTLHRQCVTIRFRGDDNNYTVDDAISLMVDKYLSSPGPRHYRMGIMILEDVDVFFPVRIHGNYYHMYHFIELFVLAYVTLHRIATTLPLHADIDRTYELYNMTSTTLSKGSPSISVPWIFSPHMSPLEVCGGASKINCLLADLILRGSTNSIFTSRSGIVGLNVMEEYPFDYEDGKNKAIDHRIELAKSVYAGEEFADDADGVIMVERFGCDMGGINKPWSRYIDHFPAHSWHSDLLYGLGRSWNDHKSRPKQLIVGYVDRQNTDRRLPSEHHDWIVEYATQHQNIEFRHLHMEEYTPKEQVEKASECDMMIGMHGNGMTHTFWMQPRRYVIEFFWKYNYQYDYSTIAQMMKHSYLGILNGKVVNSTLVENRDPSLRSSPTRKEAQQASVNESMQSFEHEGKVAIQNFIEKALLELNIA